MYWGAGGAGLTGDIEEIQEELEAACLTLLFVDLVKLVVVEPLEGFGAADQVAGGVAGCLELVAVHSESFRVTYRYMIFSDGHLMQVSYC